MRVAVDGRSLGPTGRGVAHYAAGMLAALAGPDLDLRVVLPRGRGPAVGGVRVGVPSRVLHGTAAVARRPRLDRLAGGADVVWMPAPAPVAVSRGMPLVLSLHDLSFAERPGDFTPYERAWHRLARIGALARRALVVASTEDTARRARERWGLTRVVAAGAGPGAPGPPAGAERVAEVRRRFGLPERYFLYVGALEPRKGVDVLVRAFARARDVDAALAVAGSGRLAPLVDGEGVHRLGRVGGADKGALLAGALAVVLPSWLEGYGLPPLEGFAHGTPAIVSDLPALRETAGGGARFVPAGDEAALAAALTELAGDPELRARLAAAGAKALAARSWPACAAALRAALEEAVA